MREKKKLKSKKLDTNALSRRGQGKEAALLSKSTMRVKGLSGKTSCCGSELKLSFPDLEDHRVPVILWSPAVRVGVEYDDAVVGQIGRRDLLVEGA